MTPLIRFLFASLVAVSAVHAFSVAPPAHASSLLVRHMAASDKSDNEATPRAFIQVDPLQPMDAPVEEEKAADDSDSSASEVKAVYTDLNTGEAKEVNWVDPAMSANSNPFADLGWAYAFLLYPATLIANDIFHFIDCNGPLGFMCKTVL